MPLGEVADDRSDHYIPLHHFIAPLRRERAIWPIDKRTGGPARYFAVEGSPLTLGLITPLSDHFRSQEHTSELQPLMRNSYAVFCLTKHTVNKKTRHNSSIT